MFLLLVGARMLLSSGCLPKLKLGIWIWFLFTVVLFHNGLMELLTHTLNIWNGRILLDIYKQNISLCHSQFQNNILFPFVNVISALAYIICQIATISNMRREQIKRKRTELKDKNRDKSTNVLFYLFILSWLQKQRKKKKVKKPKQERCIYMKMQPYKGHWHGKICTLHKISLWLSF